MQYPLPEIRQRVNFKQNRQNEKRRQRGGDGSNGKGRGDKTTHSCSVRLESAATTGRRSSSAETFRPQMTKRLSYPVGNPLFMTTAELVIYGPTRARERYTLQTHNMDQVIPRHARSAVSHYVCDVGCINFTAEIRLSNVALKLRKHSMFTPI